MLAVFYRSLFYFFLLLGVLLFPNFNGNAQTIVSPSSPITNICVGSTQTLSDITVVETSTSGFSGSGTFILTPPLNFEFVSGSGAVLTSGAELSATSSLATSSGITINFTVGGASSFDFFTITGLQVRAIAPSSFGNITRAGGTFIASGQASGSVTSYGFVSSVEPPAITNQPTSQVVCAGSTFSFSVAASGSGLSYQWQNDLSGSFSNITGATSNTYLKTGVSIADAGQYRVIVTGSASCVPVSVTSNAVTLSVSTPASIVTQPVSQIFCVGGNINLSVSASGNNLTYQWKKNGVEIPFETGNTYTKLNSGLSDAGNYSVEVTSNITCGSSLVVSNNALITINPLPTATISYSGSPYCATGTATVNRSGQSGGTYSSTAGLSINSSTGLIDFAASTAGTYTVTYNFTNGTCPNSTTTTLTINPLPNATISYLGSPYCAVGTAIVNQSGQGGGTYSSTAGLSINTSSGLIDLGTSTPGTYTVNYIFTNGTCPNTTTTTITINALPTATVSYSVSPYCAVGTASVTQLGQGGGTYGSTAGLSINTTNGLIDLGASTPGTYTITYNFTNGTCSNSTATTVTINALPTATISYSGSPFCATGTVSATQLGQSGGTYSATAGLSINTSTGQIDLGASTAGTYTVTYNFTNGTCPSSTTTVITINALPTASINYSSSPYCALGTASVIQLGQAGGTYSSTSGLSINASNGLINLVTTTAGTYVVSYNFTNGTCPSTTTTTVTINALPTATINYAGSPYCASGTASVTQLGQIGGTYTSTLGLSINASTGLIDLGASTAGVYTVTYNFINGTCLNSTTATVVINTLPTASISYSGSPFCATGTASVLQSGQLGGTYSSTSGLSINATTGLIDLGASAAGTYTVMYNFTNAICPSSTSTTITINTLPTALISYSLSPYCAVGTATVSQSGQTGGVFSSTAGLSINASTGLIDLVTSTLGTYLVTYNFTNGTCLNSTTAIVTINALPTASISYSGSPFCAVGTAMVNQSGQGGGVYSSTGGLSINTSSGLINLGASTPGTYTVNYDFTNGSCSSSATTTVTINSLPTASISYSASAFCAAGIANVNQVGQSGGTYSSTAGLSINTSNGLINLGASVAGTYPVTYNFTNGTCSNTISTSVVINALPSTSSITGPTTVCANSSGIIYSVLNSPGSTYQWNITGGIQSGGTNTNSISVNWDASANGSVSVTETNSTGCIGSLVSLTGIVKSVCNVDISIANPSFSICRGVTSASLFYSSTVGNPDSYRLDFAPSAESQGFVDVPFAANNLPASPIGVVVPVNALPGSYSAFITVRNTGNTFQSPSYLITITVNPTPALNSTLTPVAICSGSVFDYTPTGSVPGSTFSWTRPVVSGITEAMSAGAGNVNEVLTNVTTSAISVTYQYIAIANGCSGVVQNVVVVVYPIPILSSSLSPAPVCSGAIFSYVATSATSNASFSWTRAVVSGIAESANSGLGNVSETLTNTTTAPINVVYQYTATANSCNSSLQNVVVVVNPISILTSSASPPSICSGSSFVYSPTSTISGTSYSWSRAFVSGISQSASVGTGDVNETLTNTTTDPISVTYRYTTIVNGCASGFQNVTVVVNPIPVLSSTFSPPPICSGSSFNYSPMSVTSGSTFAWTRLVTSGIAEGAASGTGNISETLTNTLNVPVNVSYRYITTANGCSSTIQNVVVVVNPIPLLSSTLTPAPVCSGAIFSYAAIGATSGSTFGWSRSVVSGISQSAGAGSGNIIETLTNTTSDPISVTYEYTAFANGCSSGVQNVVVVVNPTPVLSSTSNPAAICSGSAFSYIASGATLGSSFNWSRSAVAGIAPTTSSGTGNVNEVLTNSTAVPISVTYRYTTTANGCTSGIQDVVVVVNPTPILSGSITPPAICSGAIFSYSPTSATLGSSFSWTRAAISGISEMANSGTGSVNEVLTNSTTVPINVIYQYIASANGCSSGLQSVLLVVNPSPALNSSLTPPAVCSGALFSYIATSATPGSSFSWSRMAISGISQSSSSGTGNIAEILTNTTTDPISVTYQFTSAASSCSGSVQNVLVLVHPIPELSSSLSAGAICSGSEFSYVPESATLGSSFGWTRLVVSGIVEAANSGAGAAVESLTNSTANPISVTYRYTSTANGCSSNAQNVVVFVNPQPIVNPQPNRAVCNGSDSSPIALTGTGTDYLWTNSNPLIGLAVSSGGGTIPLFNAVNSGNAPINSDISVTPFFTGNGITCGGLPESFTITVNPTPTVGVSEAVPVVCNGSQTNIVLTNTNNIPGVTTFDWTLRSLNNLAGAFDSSGSSIIQTLTSVDAKNSGTVIYRIIATSAFGCQNAPTFVPTTVLPPPNFSLLNTTPVICDRDRVNVAIFSDVANAQIRVKGVQYAPVSGGLSPGSLFVNGQTISEALFNATSAPVLVTYTLEAIVGSCLPSPEQVTSVLVNPTPVFTIDNANLSQCSGSNTSITLDSPTSNSIITLTAVNYNSVTGGTSTIGNVFTTGQSIVEPLINNGSFPINVFYTFSANASGCSSTSNQTTSILVNPNPTFSLTNNALSICSSSSTNILFSSTVSGAQISLASVNYGAVIGSLAPGALFVNGQRLSETLINTTNAPVTVVYEFVASVGLCEPSASTFTSVTVAPSPVMTILNTSPSICSGEPTSVLINSTTIGSIITLTAVNYDGLSGTVNVGDTFVNGGSIAETLINTTNTIVNVYYTFSVSANGCANPAIQTVSVAVSPAPIFLVTNLATSICSGSRANISFNSTVLGQQIRLRSIDYGAATGTLTSGTLFTNGQSLTNFLFNNSNSPTTVSLEFEGFLGSCINGVVQTASVVVNPNPTFSVVPSATTICSGNSVNLQFLSPTSGHQINLVGVNYGVVSGGNLVPGTSVFFNGDNFTETLTNNSNNQVTVTYLFYVNTLGSTPSCALSPVNQSVSIVVNPAPRFSVLNSSQQLCSGNQTSINLTTSVTGAQISLKAVNYNGIIGSVTYAPGTIFANNFTLSETLLNPFLNDQSVDYSFEATVSGCPASPSQLATIVVSQATSLQILNNAPSICTGNFTDFQLLSTNLNPVITLNAVNYNGVIGGRQVPGLVYSSGQIINEVLQNNTSLPITVSYSFSVSASGCPGSSISTVSVVVNPLPLVSFSGLIDQVADNDPPFILVGNQRGGIFTITPATSTLGSTTVNVTDEVFVIPSLITPGINTILYTFQDANGCTNSKSQSFIIVRSSIIDFFVSGYVADAGGQFEVCANIGKVKLIGTPSVSEGQAPDTKFSGPGRLVFFDGTDYFLDTEGATSGIYSIRYDFKNSLNATTTKIKTVKILASPVAEIDASNSCITDAIPFKDVSTINPTPFTTAISGWKWEFGSGNQSSLKDPLYIFPIGTQPGVKEIALTVTTDQGCSNKALRSIRVGPKPVVDFVWSAICDQEITKFESRSTVQFSTITEYTWDFGDGNASTGVSSLAENTYRVPRLYNAKLSVKTNDGCTANSIKKVFILPFKSISAGNSYVEDFETSTGNWVPVSLSNTDTSWVWGSITGATLSKQNPNAPSSTKAWWTGKFYSTSGSYAANERSAVNGPCINISSLNRPMISLDYFSDTQINVDGAVLQYFDDNARRWLNIGVRDEGLNWYNSSGTTSNPGAQDFPYSWSGNSEREWVTARFNLDTIPVAQRGKVAIRLAFSSDVSNPTIAGNTYEGFAFDNVVIGEKKRNVLVERFTNASLEVYREEDGYISNLYNSQIQLRGNIAASNFNFIQHHISFPGLDSLNIQNPDDPAARAAIFSLTQPATIADGATDRKFRPANTQNARVYLDSRSLDDPQFDILLNAKKGNSQNTISFDFTITKRPSFKGSIILVYVALVEDSVQIKGTNGFFRNVLRKQLLGGDGLTRIWNTNQAFIKETFNDVVLSNCRIGNPKKLSLIMYIQNKNSDDSRFSGREIYQSISIRAPEVVSSLITGIEEDTSTDGLDVAVYPNPASQLVKVKFNKEINEEFSITIVDQRGIQVASQTANPSNSKISEFDVSNLSDGIYHLIINERNKHKIYKKLVVLKGN
jgi:hypothetical protein